MKFLLGFGVLLLLGIVLQTEAVTEPVCGYKNSEGETIFLKYLPYLKKGQDYVDFGADGKCIKKATCSETFHVEIEDCSAQKITCESKKRQTDVFPGCCIKC